MSIRNNESEFVTYVIDSMQPLGCVHAKRMFGGHGIFLQGLMFGLIADSVLYLKADKDLENDFIVRRLEAFQYQKKNKLFKISYYQVPEEALENDDVMFEWATKSYQAAIRAADKKRVK